MNHKRIRNNTNNSQTLVPPKKKQEIPYEMTSITYDLFMTLVAPKVKSIMMDSIVEMAKHVYSEVRNDVSLEAISKGIQQEVNKNIKIMHANLMNTVFTSDLTADLVGWSPQPVEKIAEANEESKLLSALTMKNALRDIGIDPLNNTHIEHLQSFISLSQLPSEEIKREAIAMKDVRPGMQVYYTFYEGTAEHHGVVTENGKVVEVINRLFPLGPGRNTVRCIITTSDIEDFYERARGNNSEVFTIHYTQNSPIEQIMSRVRLSLGRWNYHMVFHNCEHVATWIATGSYNSIQCNKYMMKGGIATKKTTNLLMQKTKNIQKSLIS